MFSGGCQEFGKKRMPIARCRVELGVKLTGNKPRVRGNLDHFDKIICRAPLHPMAGVFQRRTVLVVHFIAVAMPFGNGFPAVNSSAQ